MEALAHKGSAEAVTELNSFMKTRQPDYNYTFTNKADLIEEIIYQKRVEFWGEGLEYIDNRRLNIPVDRTDETWAQKIIITSLPVSSVITKKTGRSFTSYLSRNRE